MRLLSESNEAFDALLMEIRLFRFDLRIAVVLALIFYAISFYNLYSKRQKPQIIVIQSAQLAQLAASRKLEWAGGTIRPESKEAERNDPNVVPDAEDPPSRTGPECPTVHRPRTGG